MGFIGVQPASVPLTASDIEADIINSTHIGDTAISGFTALAEAPADTDEFLLSDGGVLKRIDASFVGGGVDGVTSSSSSTAISIDSDGHVLKPLQPAFLVKTGSTVSNYATATTHTVSFSSEIFDQNADFNTSTYAFTAPITGRYQLSADLKINNIDKDSDYYSGAIVCSNRSIGIFNIRTAQVFNEDSTYYRWVSSCLVDMDANDTAYVTFRPQAGDATADINGNESLFAGFLAC